jgi:predicted RNA binding protein YcfA (HicA-like mRNA interferase family)
MSKRPSLSGRAIIDVLKEHGFAVKRQKGSHVFLAHPDGRATVVPVHAGETIGPGLFAKILRDTDLSKTDFIKPSKK